MTTRTTALATVVFAFIVGPAYPSTNVVRIDTGLVEGVSERGVTVYKGVPFAAPPVGQLRWRAPQSVKRWSGVYKANAFKPQCMQLGPPLPTMPEEPTSEDCLYLNVWTPALTSQSKRAVMVFIHGGNFRKGSPSTPLYWGDELARNNDVVVINITYRVGPLGFLVHPDLTAESDHRASGNYGLMDAIAALQWVRRNAAAFGGDPAKVTVFGQSAGAWIINKLMISPLADGLFRAAIAQSGGDMGPTRTSEGLAVLADAEKSGVAFAQSFRASTIKALRDIPADRITASTFDGVPGIPHSNAALPIVDGYVIPDDTYSLYAAGKQAKVPLLLGYNADEGAYLVKPLSIEDFTANVRRQYGALADRLLELLAADSSGASAEMQERLWAETNFGWQVWSWARVHSQTSGRAVFFYHYSGKQNGHGAELPYVFQHPFMREWTGDDRRTAEVISGYWTRFAKTGNPNAAGSDWPTYSSERGTVMHLGEKTGAGDMPDVPLHMLMDAYMDETRRKR